MEKKTLIVVGAGKGLGNAIAREFASHGFRVALIARNAERLASFKKEMEAEGIETYTRPADALRPETLTAAIRDLTRELGTPDCLVYNVGNITPDGDGEIKSETLLAHYQVDVASAYHCANLVATEEFAKKKGAILFTGGGFAKTFRPIPFLKALCIDKAAMNAMNIVLHVELAPKGIFVGSVLVNGVITPGDGTHAPARIAAQYWKMYTEREEYELLY